MHILQYQYIAIPLSTPFLFPLLLYSLSLVPHTFFYSLLYSTVYLVLHTVLSSIPYLWSLMLSLNLISGISYTFLYLILSHSYFSLLFISNPSHFLLFLICVSILSYVLYLWSNAGYICLWSASTGSEDVRIKSLIVANSALAVKVLTTSLHLIQ